MIPQPEEAIFLSAADHRMLLEAALVLPPDQSVVLARRLLASQFDGTQRKHLEVLCQALELDAQNASPEEILEVLREELGGAAPSSDLALLLSSTLIARLTQRDLSYDECWQLAELAVTLAVPKPGERLTNGLTRFFRQVGEQFLRTGASTDSLDRLFAPLANGLMLRVAPESLASMLPEEQHTAQIALAACFAGRGLLRPDFVYQTYRSQILQAPPELKNSVHRITRAYFYLCLHHHFAMDVVSGLASGEQAQRYLTSALGELDQSWPELDSMFGIASAPLNEPMASQLLQAVHAASRSWSGDPLSEWLASRGLELLQAWVTSTKVRNMLGSKPS
jgi:hypothetical protein